MHPLAHPAGLPSRRAGHTMGRMSDVAIILVDHGSRRPAANEALAAVAELAGRRLKLTVHVAHLAHGEPTLGQAIERAAGEGARRVVVCPYFLAGGVHTEQDIPSQVAQAAGAHPDVRVEITQPLGPDALLAELVCRRVQPHLPAREAV